MVKRTVVILTKNSDYWHKRAEILEKMKYKSAGNYTASVERQFSLAQKTLDEQIEQWYGRFAVNNQISLTEARQWLTGKDLAEFKWDLNEYIKHGKEAAVDPAFIKQLENASARFHISKLEALKIKTQNTVESLYGQASQGTKNLFGQIYTDSYYHTAFQLQQGFGIGWDIAALNPKQIESVLSKPWTLDKSTFSDKLWTQKQNLLNEVHTQLTQNLILGKAPDDAIAAIAKKFGTSKSNAGRLIMTESAYFANGAQKNAYETLGVEEFEVVGTLDGETCLVCGGMDGTHLPMAQFQAGVTAPPFHPWCRCCTAPYFPDDIGERFARGEDGKAYYVPSDMKYDEWKEKFVSGGDKGGLKQINKNGGISWVKDVPEPVKKEYLTKKKLQSGIDDLDTQMKNLSAKYDGDVSNASSDEVLKYFEMESQKKEYQTLLDKKLMTEQKKILTKKEIALQAEFDVLEVKTYSGIWKDDVSTADWHSKQNSIQAKKDYFEQQLKTAVPGNTEKWEKLLSDLAEFDAEGKQYYEVQSELKKIKESLTSLHKSGTIKPSIDDPFSQARKDAALWAKNTKEADDVLRAKCGEVWRNASNAQKDAIYEYTSSYSKFNEPLRGIEYGTNKYLGVGNVDLETIGMDYSGYKRGQVKKLIDDMTDIIDKSSYTTDVWLQRGADLKGMDMLFNINLNDFNLPENELADKLLTKTPVEHAFGSAGVAKGKGFSSKPITMNIYAPAGTKMMYAEPFSAYGNGAGRSWDGISMQSSFGNESEMILQRGTKFRVTKVEKSGGKIFIDMEVIEQGVY